MIVYGDDVSDWVAHHLFKTDREYFGLCTSIGQVLNGTLICGVVYSSYKERPDGTPQSIEMSIATIDKRWANKAYLRSIFSYPFIQLRLERVQITTSVFNEEVNTLVPRLGFVKEGTHRKGHFDGGDCYSWSMLKEECRWINE